MLITFFASVLIWILVGGVLIGVKRQLAIRAFTAFILAIIASYALKSIIPTPRPFVLGAAATQTLTVHDDGAFPSAHTAAAFALAVTILFANRRLGITLLVMAVVIGISRVIANVHWPIDIVGGAVLGSTVAIAVQKISPSPH